MPPIDLNNPLFYQFRGFDRDSFIRSANLAQQRFRRLQEESDAELDAEVQVSETTPGQDGAPISPVSTALSVPRSLKSPRLTDDQFVLPLPNYQQSTPSSVESNPTPINIYA